MSKNIKRPTIEYDDLYKPPVEIIKVLEKHIDQKHNREKVRRGSVSAEWYLFLEDLKSLTPIFTESSYFEIWKKFLKKDEKATVELLKHLLKIKAEFRSEKTLNSFVRENREQFTSIYKNILELSRDIFDYKNNNEYAILSENFDELEIHINSFVEGVPNEYREYISSEDEYYSKENNFNWLGREASEEIFFMRKLSTLFRHYFGKPYNDYVATITTAVFEKDFNEDNVKQNTKHITALVKKSKNSAS